MARVVVVGAPHHLTQRGNNGQSIFLADADRRAYLERLEQDCQACGVRLLGYCVMTNHVHFIALPSHLESFARAMRRTQSSYAQSFNRRYWRSGHLFENRFFSCVFGANHLTSALLYVDCNPVRAGMVGEATERPWSSAAAHAAGHGDPFVDGALWSEVRATGGWAEALRRGAGGRFEQRLRTATYAGTPCGDAAFLAELERKMGRRLGPGKRGPKPKQLTAASGGSR
jgi:putative transposase